MFSTKGLIDASKGLIRAKTPSLFPLKVWWAKFNLKIHPATDIKNMKKQTCIWYIKMVIFNSKTSISILIMKYMYSWQSFGTVGEIFFPNYNFLLVALKLWSWKTLNPFFSVWSFSPREPLVETGSNVLAVLKNISQFKRGKQWSKLRSCVSQNFSAFRLSGYFGVPGILKSETSPVY